MHDKGLTPNTQKLNCMIKGACELEFAEYAEYVFDEMFKRGVRELQQL